MAYKRRRYGSRRSSRRRIRRPRRSFRKSRRYGGRGRRRFATRVYRTTRTYESVYIIPNGEYYNIHEYFQITELNGYKEWTNMFQYYRVTGLKYTVIPQHNSSQQMPGGGVGYEQSLLHMYVRKKPLPEGSGNVTAKTLDEFQQDPSVKRYWLSRPHSFYVRYPPTYVGGDAGQSVYYTAPVNRWTVLGTPSQPDLGANVRWYGAQFLFDPFGSNQVLPHRVKVVVKAYIKFKEMRMGDVYPYANPT